MIFDCVQNVLMKLNYFMFASKRISGFLLMEVMIVLTIISLILPKILELIRFNYEKAYQIISDNQRLIEKMDIYSQIVSDTSDQFESLSDCCIKTSLHEICYDIKNNQFRRRKKQRRAQRFYTHYIGKKKQFSSIKCEYKNKLITIKFKHEAGEETVWAFYIDHS